MTVKTTAVNTHEYRQEGQCTTIDLTTVIPFQHTVNLRRIMKPMISHVPTYITKMAEPRVSFTMTQKASKKSLIKRIDSEENTKDIPRNVDFIHSLEDQEIKRLFKTSR